MKNLPSISIRRAIVKDIPIIQEITYATWPAAYKEILSGEQLDYMLRLMYDTAVLEKQLRENHHFIIAEINRHPVGFAGFSVWEQPGIYKLHKLYVLPSAQGSGAGKMLLQWVIKTVKTQHASRLLLNVNRANKAIHFYQKMGFEILYGEDIDIGQGYFMNDYVMGIDFISSNIPPLK